MGLLTLLEASWGVCVCVIEGRLVCLENKIASDASPQFAHVTFLIWSHLKKCLDRSTSITHIKSHGGRPPECEENFTENPG